MSTWSGGRTLGTVAILFSFLLVGCAARLGSEALTPVAASAGGKTMQIYVATTRERDLSQNAFTANLANALNFARFSVSVPPNHKSGKIEMPTATPDPERDFAVVDRAALSEPEFRQAVTHQTNTQRKKHKVFVFVHGFNNTFQESLFRITQLQADMKIDGIPILFAWPSQGRVGAYEIDKQSANYSRDYLMALLTMLSSNSEVSDIMVVAHSMGAMLTVEALRQLRTEGKDRVIARLSRVVLAAPDINARTFRTNVQAIGPLKPPLLVLVSKDDGALRASSFLDGCIARAGDIDVDNPIVREAALKEKVQVVDISRLAKHDDLGHDRFVSVAVLYSRSHEKTLRYRNTAGTFIFTDDDTFLRPIDIGNRVAQ
ncbi:alpha/beta hydrolase [Nitrobacter sp. TKz-YC02]|uniref:alpha/beta hydrolase n=1 Tax=Nitrobacter sp. TKz-YC02 TaxID=3398704 RepID=UPI003CF07522